MKTAKQWMFAAILTLCGMAQPATAQRIQTVDTDGKPIPYASVMTMDAKVIGTTGLDGILEDVKGADTISISHVAYKSKKVKLNGKGGRITLEDADFNVPEITITKKPLIYQQIYYRIVFVNDANGLIYYRAGIMENAYDRKTLKVNYSEDHMSASYKGIIKTLVNTALNMAMKEVPKGMTKSPEESLMEDGKDVGLKITADGANRKRISDNYGELGYILNNPEAGLRRFVWDDELLEKHKLQATGKQKKIDKKAKRDAKHKNKQETSYEVYRLNEDGSYSPEDFVMMQMMESSETDRGGHEVMIMEFFTTDRAYVTKDELKQLRKDNKMKMNYSNIRHFEKLNKIPALPSVVQEKLSKFVTN